MLTFRILGSIEIRRDERRLELGGPRQVALLAFLLVHANRAVSTDRLIDALWAEQDPAGAAKRVQMAIARVRKLLREAEPSTVEPLLRTVPGGYLLATEPERVDAGVFAARVQEGRRELAGGAPARAAELLRDGLGLWRGPALADVADEPWARAEIASLEDLRLTALEARAEADLELGSDAELVGELQSLVAAHPTRERLVSQLMIALYRAGRQAEALATYREVTQRLMDELGLESSPALRELERAILAHDPGLHARPSPADDSSPPATSASPALAALPFKVTAEEPIELVRPHGPPSERAVTEVRKIVTVVCCDGGFSGSYERVDSEVLGGMMSRYFATLQSVLERHGGRVETFMGDALMAVFGLPVAHEDDALRAVRAALEMRESLAATNDARLRAHGLMATLRTAIFTGEVLAGGARATEANVVVGEAINLAVHLRESAEPGQILLGETTYRLVRNAVQVEPAELRGRARSLGAWRLERLLPLMPAPTIGAPLVGRDRELGILRAAFDQAVADQMCRLVTVTGAAGIGKSRLAGEFAASLKPPTRVLRGRCLSYGEGITYWPLAEIVKDIMASGGPDALAHLLSADPQADLLADRVAGAVGLSPTESLTEEILWAVRRIVEAVAGRGPLILILDDIHWAEPTFLDLIEYLAAFAKGPLVLLCLARPELFEVRASWAASDGVQVALAPLSSDDAERLLGRLGPLPAAVGAEVLKRAEGNPLFVEHLVALAREANGNPPPVSPTIQALLTARVDRLTEGERAVAECAAIEGRQFHRRAVSSLVADSLRDEVPAHLLALMRKQIVRPAPALYPEDDGFRFAHVLVRDAAYDATPKERRAVLHERFADWLTGIAPDAAVAQDEILGYHLEQAHGYRRELGRFDAAEDDLARRAAEPLAAAGRRALARGDMSATAALLGRAAALLESDPRERLALLHEWAFALSEIGEVAKAEEILDEAVATARAGGDTSLEWRAALERSWVRFTREGGIEEPIATAKAALEALARIDDREGLARGWQLTGVFEFQRVNCAAAQQALERAVEYAVEADASRVHTEALVWLLIVCVQGPMPAEEGIRRCGEVLASTENQKVRAYALMERGVLEAMQGRPEAGRKNVADGRRLLRDLGFSAAAEITCMEAAIVELLADNPSGAKHEASMSREALERMGQQGFALATVWALADVAGIQGEYREALELSNQTEAMSTGEDPHAQISWRRIKAPALARVGELDQAERLAREAVDLAFATDSRIHRGDTSLALGMVLKRLGNAAEAESSYRRAETEFSLKGDVVSAAKARALALGSAAES